MTSRSPPADASTLLSYSQRAHNETHDTAQTPPYRTSLQVRQPRLASTTATNSCSYASSRLLTSTARNTTTREPRVLKEAPPTASVVRPTSSVYDLLSPPSNALYDLFRIQSQNISLVHVLYLEIQSLTRLIPLYASLDAPRLPFASFLRRPFESRTRSRPTWWKSAPR